MSDADQTIVSGSGSAGLPGASPSAQGSDRKPLLIIGGIGCLVLICAALGAAGGYFLLGDPISELVAGTGSEETPTIEIVPPATPVTPTPLSTPTLLPTPEILATATEMVTNATPGSPEQATDEPGSSGGDQIAAAEPHIGALTFARDATDDYEPVGPATLFEGEVTEVHAIFEYSGLSPDYTWERVWYLDGQEMLRSAELWAGAEAGIFDYFINAGGSPLSPGEWVLELYFEGELLAEGSFIIAAPGEVDEVAAAGTDEAEEAEATSEPDPGSQAITPTVTLEPTAPPPHACPDCGGDL